MNPYPPRRTKWAVPLVAIVAVLAIGAIVGIVVWQSANDDSLEDTEKKTRLDATTEGFLSAFAHAAQQPVVRITLTSQSDNKIRNSDSTFDYRSKKVTYRQTITFNEEELNYLQCEDGTGHVWDEFTQAWERHPDPTNSICKYSNYPIADSVNDGINTGGLTKTQAEKFVAALRKPAGLIKASKKTINHHGKDYLRFDVVVNSVPISSEPEAVHEGAGCFSRAFARLGLDQATHPYTLTPPSNSGITFNYIVDPTTNLPVYAHFLITPHTREGQLHPATEDPPWRVQYAFPTTLPDDALPETPHPINLAWPADRPSPPTP